MWFMNHVTNPLVRLILRSPLHILISPALLLLTYRGRKSGKQYTLPVQYAQKGAAIYIIPGMPEQKTWWRNLKGGAPVQVTLRGQVLAGKASLLDPQADAAEMLAGVALYLQRFPGLAKYHNIRAEAGNQFNEADVRRAAQTVVMIRVDLEQS